MQISAIAISLKELASASPMASALATAGLAGGLHYGSKASRSAARPFATFSVEETDQERNSSGVALVTYTVSLSVVCEQRGEVAAAILEIFHRYWDRIVSLPTLNSVYADFVLIHPEASEIGEAEEEDLGADVIIGNTSWTLLLSEYQPEIEE